jgi:hypothetical protein
MGTSEKTGLATWDNSKSMIAGVPFEPEVRNRPRGMNTRIPGSGPWQQIGATTACEAVN